MGQHSPSSGSNNGFIQKVTSNWDESAVTWNNQPTSTTVGQVSLPVSTSPDEDYLFFDVTNLVEDMYANPSSNYGFMLKFETESAYRMLNFASSDHLNANLHPQLEVCYTGELSLIEFNSDLASQILIYPNSANEFINVRIVNTDLIGAIFKIFDDLGRKVYSHSVDSESFSVDVSSFAKGLYVINLSYDLHDAIRFVKL